MAITGDRSASSILEDIVRNVQGIIRSEVRLAKAEIQEEAVKSAKAAGLLAVGAVVALYSAGFLLLTCMFALDVVLPRWLSALIVAVLVAIAAGALIKVGLERIRRVDHRPDQTINSIKENFQWAKNQTK